MWLLCVLAWTSPKGRSGALTGASAWTLPRPCGRRGRRGGACGRWSRQPAPSLVEGAPEVTADRLHRLDKADTKGGLSSIQSLAQLGVPYPMLLYEWFLGRPFAGHKDSVSE